MNDPEVKCGLCEHSEGVYPSTGLCRSIRCYCHCVFPAPSPDAAVEPKRPARHAFDPIDSSNSECECGLLREAPIHLSDDVAGDKFVPFIAAGDVREAAAGLVNAWRADRKLLSEEGLAFITVRDYKALAERIAALITEERDATKRRWATAHCILCPDSDGCKDVAELRQRAEKAEADTDNLHEKLIENNTQYAEEAKASENVRRLLAAAEARVKDLEAILRHATSVELDLENWINEEDNK